MTALNRKSLSEQIYWSLRDDIISGKIKQGERLNTNDLKDRFQVSMTPIREAVMRLSQDRFVENVTNHYTKVTELTRENIIELLDISCLFDRYSIHVCMKLDEETKKAAFSEMQAEVDKQRKDIQNVLEERQEYESVFNGFHNILYKYTNNKRLFEIAIQNNNLLFLADCNTDNKKYPMEAANEHQAILDAMKSGDENLALEKADEHRANEKVRFGL
jgi:GntR family transcriptional regulator, rspAB operon transcriptional repressor